MRYASWICRAFASHRLAFPCLRASRTDARRPRGRRAALRLWLPQAFKEMVDSLLELHLSEMGVSQSQFFQTLAKNPHAKRSKQILEQLLVIDDFLSFKKMMGKRNAELEAEVLNMIKNYADPPSPICGADDDYDYELQLERAMKLSIVRLAPGRRPPHRVLRAPAPPCGPRSLRAGRARPPPRFLLHLLSRALTCPAAIVPLARLCFCALALSLSTFKPPHAVRGASRRARRPVRPRRGTARAGAGGARDGPRHVAPTRGGARQRAED